MARGEKEWDCLEVVKNSFNRFRKENQYGISREDTDELENMFKIVKPNENSNDFPDFVFENGFIEHFQITSSKQSNKKGAEHIKNKSVYSARLEKSFERYMTSEYQGIMHSDFRYGAHSYEWLKESFKMNWENHINSLEKYETEYKTGIFMVQYIDGALLMAEDIYGPSGVDGFSMPIRAQQYFEDYQLSRDKELLTYLQGFKDKIKYVFFVNYSGVEFISLEHIDSMIKLLPWDFLIDSGYGMTETNMFAKITIPDIESENNDCKSKK